MRNLQLLMCTSASVPKLENVQLHFSLDEGTGTFYINTAEEIIGVNIALDEENFCLPFDELGGHSEVKIAGLQFLQGEESLCVATEHGDLLIINIPTKTVECVGSVDSGLVSMKWSPDQELVLLGTGHDTIIAMTREFDPVAEIDIYAKEFGKGEFVTVGWGKKETQFHGSEGKSAAKKKEVPIMPALAWDDRNIRIVWRGDGQNFSVSMIDPENGNRKFRVWSRECVLQYTSEYISGLESCFAWRPSGNLLASSQRKPHRHDIVFFEPNGLQHGEFTLPFKKDEVMVKQLEWNSDSSILAIWLKDMKADETNEIKLSQYKFHHFLQLWTMSNYHWYLKRSMKFNSDKSPICIQWDSEQSHQLNIIFNNGRYSQYVFGKLVNDSTSPKSRLPSTGGKIDDGVGSEDNLSFVAVIDGKNVLMTPFKSMVIPPPISAYQLCLPVPVNTVRFLLSQQLPNDIAVFLSNGKVALFTTQKQSISDELSKVLTTRLDAAGGNGFNPRITPHSPRALLQIVDNTGSLQDITALHHWMWLDISRMFAIGSGSLPGRDYVFLLDIDYEKSTLIISKYGELQELVLSAHNCEDNNVALQTKSGKMLICEIPSLIVSEYLLNGEEMKLPRPCVHVSMCTFSGSCCVVALSEHSRMYIDNMEVASDCSSFCIHDDFLFMTTHSHKLRCINRNISLDDLKRYFKTPLEGRSSLQNCGVVEMHRAIERGSRIVTITPSDCRLILQMPRGNLEQIFPRCLVLSVITKFIKSLKYGEAFTIMKKHRINMNLFYDIDPELLKENTENFLINLKSCSNINVFISDVQDEDFTQTMYKQYFGSGDNNIPHSAISSSTAVGKINRVCDFLITDMEKDEKRYITSLITAHIKKSPSEVGLALTRIKKLSDSSQQDDKLVQDALKYMTVLVEGNTLFNEALGTYDFKLVMMVAEKSQLDPKEFMPVLHELQKYEDDYRKYKIDVKLRRYQSALEHILKCEDRFDECLRLIIDHEMYRNAIKIFEQGTENYKKICCAYGEFLKKKQLYEEAGNIYSRCSELEQALECFTLGMSSSLALSTAFKLGLHETEMLELAYKLAERAKEKRRYAEAANVLEHYANDIELAVEAALAGELWQTTARMTSQHQRQDLEESLVLPALLKAYEEISQNLEESQKTLVKHTARLEVVRQNKERQQREALLEGAGGMGMDSDLYSDTSSIMTGSVSSQSSSNFSRSTGRSSKSRRKKKSRGYSLKEGGRFEDLALLHSLKSTIMDIDKQSENIHSLSLHMSFFKLDEKAEHLTSIYMEVRNTAINLLPTIWSRSKLQETGPTSGPQATVNSILAATQNQNRLNSEITNLEEEQSFDGLELFLPPKITKSSSWALNLYSSSGVIIKK